MLSPRRTLLPLAALLLAAACGDDEAETKPQPQRQERPARHVADFSRQSVPDLGRLVPADAVALVVFAPPARLEPKLAAFLESVAAGREPVLEQLLALGGATLEDIDRDRPFAIALTLGEENRPQPTFILPAKGGDYVAKGYATPAAGTAHPLARDLPGGDAAFRVDLARLLPAFRPSLDPYLSADGLVGLEPQLSSNPTMLAMLDTMAAGARALLDSADRLEGALVLDGGKVDLNVALSVKEGSALDTPATRGGVPFAELVKSIDAKRCAMTILMRYDPAQWIDFFRPFLRSIYGRLPDGEKRLQRYLEKYGALYGATGPSLAAGVDFGADGMRMSGVMDPPDAAKYLALYREAIVVGSTPELGMAIDPAEPVESGGVTLHTYRINIDWQKLMGAEAAAAAPEIDETFRKATDAVFGPEGIEFAQAAVGGRVIMALRGSYAESVATAKEQSGGVAPAVAAAATDETTCLFHVDMRRMLAGMSALIAKMMPELRSPEIPAGPPVDIWLRVSRGARTYAFALHVDAAGTVELARPH